MLGVTNARVRWAAFLLPVTLGGTAWANEPPTVEVIPSDAVKENLTNDGVKLYDDFCKEAAADLNKLSKLFSENCAGKTNPEAEWTKICDAALESTITHQSLVRGELIDKTDVDAYLAWFRTLKKIWTKLQKDGLDAFTAKVKLDVEMAHRKVSIENNAILKADYKTALLSLDETYGQAEECLKKLNSGKSAGAKWLATYKEENNESFIAAFTDAKTKAENHEEAAIGGAQAVADNIAEGRPDLDSLKKGPKHLSDCAFYEELLYFESYVEARKQWHVDLVKLHADYQLVYDQWTTELAWLLKDQMFEETANLHGRKWKTLGQDFNSMLDAINNKIKELEIEIDEE